MSVYFWLDLAILGVPFLLSFDPRVKYYRKYPAVFTAMVLVGAFFVSWDILACHYGDWAFNGRYLWPIRVAGLPLEELLFFVVVPYSCLFIYEVVCYYCPEKFYPCPHWAVPAAVLVLLSGAAFFHGRVYTFVVLGVCAVTVLIVSTLQPRMLCSRRYWFYLIFSCSAFLVFNSILTALPVVTYNPGAIWGLRVGTIPVEDFFYNYAALTLYLFVYRASLPGQYISWSCPGDKIPGNEA